MTPGRDARRPTQRRKDLTPTKAGEGSVGPFKHGSRALIGHRCYPTPNRRGFYCWPEVTMTQHPVQLAVGEFKEADGFAIAVILQSFRAEHRILESDCNWRAITANVRALLTPVELGSDQG